MSSGLQHSTSIHSSSSTYEPSASNQAIRLEPDLADTEVSGSAVTANALNLLRRAVETDGLKLTATGNYPARWPLPLPHVSFRVRQQAFSLQAAYAAPLILRAQTRQAERDAAHARADAEHREALHTASEERATLAADQTTLLVEMLRQNTQLTEAVKALTEPVEALTLEVHKTVVNSQTA